MTVVALVCRVRLNSRRRVYCDWAVVFWSDLGFLRVFYCFGNCFCAGFICRDITGHGQPYNETLLRQIKAILQMIKWCRERGFMSSLVEMQWERYIIDSLAQATCKTNLKFSHNAGSLTRTPWSSAHGFWIWLNWLNLAPVWRIFFFLTNRRIMFRYSTSLVRTIRTAIYLTNQPTTFSTIPFSLSFVYLKWQKSFCHLPQKPSQFELRQFKIPPSMGLEEAPVSSVTVEFHGACLYSI